jgi:Flp pilus assembly secretin CpaC
MSLSSLRMRVRAPFAIRSLAIGMFLWPVAALATPDAPAVSAPPAIPAAPVPDAIAVNVDQAKLVRLPSRVATIVVGNPLIADVALQTGGIVVVTGKGYGATNFIAMDRTGEVLVDRIIQVQGPTDKVVTVYRGVERESYSCTPICQRRITLGDGEGYFKSTIDQAGTLASSASSASAAGKPTN